MPSGVTASATGPSAAGPSAPDGAALSSRTSITAVPALWSDRIR
jgi:hypothetical protein